MEIKSTTLFLIGIIVLMLGVSVIVFDYPQIQYFERMSLESYSLLSLEERNVHQRLLVEFAVGVAISAAGAGLVVLSMTKKLRQEA